MDACVQDVCNTVKDRLDLALTFMGADTTLSKQVDEKRLAPLDKKDLEHAISEHAWDASLGAKEVVAKLLALKIQSRSRSQSMWPYLL